MSEPTIASPQEPQGEQSGALPGAHSTRPAPPAYQSPKACSRRLRGSRRCPGRLGGRG